MAEALVFDETTQMWHPDTPENRRILASKSWKMMAIMWGMPAQPLPRYVSGWYLPATNPRDEGSAQSGPENPYAKSYQG